MYIRGGAFQRNQQFPEDLLSRMKAQGKPRSSLEVEAFGPSPPAKIDPPRPSPAQGVPEGRTAGGEKGPFRRRKKGEADTGVEEVPGRPQGGFFLKEAVKEGYSPLRLLPAAQLHEMGAGKPEGGGEGASFSEGAAEENGRKAEGAAPGSSEDEGGIEASSLHLPAENRPVFSPEGVKKRRGQGSPPGTPDPHFMTWEACSVFSPPGSC